MRKKMYEEKPVSKRSITCAWDNALAYESIFRKSFRLKASRCSLVIPDAPYIVPRVLWVSRTT